MLYVIIKCLQTIDSENGEKSGGKNIEIKKVDKSNIKDLSLFSIFSSVFNFCSKRVILDQKLVLIDSEFNNSDDQQSSLTSEDHAAGEIKYLNFLINFVESGIIPSPVYLRILEWLCNFSSSLTIEDKSNYDCNVARQVILIDQILLTMTISLERKIQQGVKEPFQRLSRSLTSSQSFPLSVSLSTLESWLLTVGVSIESVNRVRSSALQKIVKTRQMLFSDPVDSIPGPSQMSAGNRPDNEILTKSGGERNVFLTSS